MWHIDKIVKRTFQAKNWPVGSAERADLNLKAETSEYSTSDLWLIRATADNGATFMNTFRTKSAAHEYAARLNESKF